MEIRDPCLTPSSAASSGQITESDPIADRVLLELDKKLLNVELEAPGGTYKMRLIEPGTERYLKVYNSTYASRMRQ